MTTFNVQMLWQGQYHDWLFSGLQTSLALTAIAFVLALPLAMGIALLRLSSSIALRWLGTLYVEAIRNVPLLAHLLFWYFGAPELLPNSAKEWLYAHNAEFMCAAVAMTLYAAAYMSEDIRSGIRAVPAAQTQAAMALGLSHLATLRFIVLPQAIRLTIPPLISQTLNLWKDSSIATVIGVGELMYQAARVETATFRSTEAFSFVTLSYLGVSLLIAGAAAWYQHQQPVRLQR